MIMLFMLLFALVIGYAIFYLFGGIGILLTMLLCAIGMIAFLIFVIKKITCVVVKRKSKED